MKLQSRTVTPQHALTNNFHGHRTLLHEAVVEFLQGEFAALQFPVVLAQFENLQLAQRVIEIRRVRSSAPGFHFGDGRNLETLMYEELLSLFDGHLSGMHFDADNEA